MFLRVLATTTANAVVSTNARAGARPNASTILATIPATLRNATKKYRTEAEY